MMKANLYTNKMAMVFSFSHKELELGEYFMW